MTKSRRTAATHNPKNPKDPGSTSSKKLKYIGVAEAARRCSVSSRFIYRAIWGGNLEAKRFGRGLRIHPAALKRWIGALPSTTEE